MEKKIIEGKLVNIKAIAIGIFAAIAGVVNLFGFMACYTQNVEDCADWKWTWDWVVEKYGKNANPFIVSLHDYVGAFFGIALIGAVLALLFYMMFSKTELIVTDKRVYGKTSFGKRVDLPLDSISAVGTAILKSIAVTTASGAIKFSLIANRDDVHSEISKLLIERQEKKATAAPVARQETPASNAAELKQYKELLDSGIISQEEFDAKKKQLLGL